MCCHRMCLHVLLVMQIQYNNTDTIVTKHHTARIALLVDVNGG